MVYIVLGCCGFLLACLIDHPRLSRIRGARFAISIPAFTMLGYSVVKVAVSPDRFIIPVGISWAAWIFTAAFFLLFMYSQFVEIPFRQAYLSCDVGRRDLVKTGTYALTRHPGVIWAALWLGCMIVATGSKLLLLAYPVWMLMDAVWVGIQDKYYFPRTFPGYDEYKKEVPMLLPTRASIKRCVETLRIRREESLDEHSHR